MKIKYTRRSVTVLMAVGNARKVQVSSPLLRFFNYTLRDIKKQLYFQNSYKINNVELYKS